MKKILLLTLALTMLLISACGGSGGQSAAPSPSGADSASAPSDTSGAQAGGGEPVLLQIGYENNPGEPLDIACNEWKKLLEEQSGGTIKVELFPSSQLGSKTDLIDQMLAGANVCTIADGAFYAERGVPDFGIVFAPYLFSTWEECWKLTESDWYAEQSDKLEDNGLKILASNWMYGDRHTLTRQPVHSPADLKGMKIRVPNSPVFVKGFEALGATPTPMALGDVYTALQQGTIDGLENPLPVLYNGKYQEVAKYLVLDGHVKNFITWVVGTGFFDSLTPEQRQVLLSTAEEAGILNNGFQEEAERDIIDKFIAEGVEVYEPTENEKAAYREAAMGFYNYEEITADWFDGLYNTVNDIIKG